MMDRRSFVAMTACGMLAHAVPVAKRGSARLAYYVSNGPRISHYTVDTGEAALTLRSSTTLPSGVQYAWPHANRRALYVVCSDMQTQHFVVVLAIDPVSGELTRLGPAVPLPFRPIHVCTDIPSQNLLVAFNIPSGVRVFRIEQDLTLGTQVPEPGVVDGGIFAHQVRVTPDNRHVLLLTRGISAAGDKPEQPGAIKRFDYDGGTLTHETSVAPNGGFGFGPRHLDFHPSKLWVYVSMERENKLFVYPLQGGTIGSRTIFEKSTLPAAAASPDSRQLAGAVHVHPNGRFVYVSNRHDATTGFGAQKVLTEGNNSIVVYAIDQGTGEPTAIQFCDTGKIDPRTFTLDPEGKMMAVQNMIPLHVRKGGEVMLVPAGITTFHIGSGGMLLPAKTYDLDVSGSNQVFWGNILSL